MKIENSIPLAVAILGILAIAATLVMYLSVGGFSQSFSISNQDWGAFGSYFGGVLTPIFGLISIVILAITLLLQQHQMRNQFEQELKRDILLLIDKQERKIDILLQQEIDFPFKNYTLKLCDFVDGVHSGGVSDNEVFNRAVYRLFILCGEYVEALMLYKDNISPHFVFRFHRKRIEELYKFLEKYSVALSSWDRTLNLGMLKELINRL